MNILLLSNSTNHGETYMNHAKEKIAQFLGNRKRVLFIPYAGVSISYDAYTETVQAALAEHGIEIQGIHQFDSAQTAIKQAEAIAVGGGNTFRLVQQLYEQGVLDLIRTRVHDGCPFVGWSAGSNVAGPTLCTTNDMPIVEPRSFDCLNLVPFQINPHYTEDTIPNHGGESRKARLEEYICLNTNDVVCLPEGSWLEVNESGIAFDGGEGFKVYQHPDQVLDFEKHAASQYFNRFKKFTSN
ncbi:MAG: dipeptidase PepE [Bacteroidia bacterium]|nr:dipeptidase PepE [Bacteroidia bacterium]